MEPLYTSVGVNRSPHCLDWNGTDVIYAASNAVVRAIADPADPSAGPKCVDTLLAHEDRVNCVRFLSAKTDCFVSCSTDATAVFWSKFAPCQTLKGHNGSVTVASGAQVGQDNEGYAVATASTDSTVILWTVSVNSAAQEDTIQVPKSGFANDVNVTVIEGHVMLFVATDDCGIHVHGKKRGGEDALRKLHVLKGHEDWVKCLDICINNSTGDILLASGGQDNYIRLWRFGKQSNAVNGIGGDADEIKLKEETIDVSPLLVLTVRLETVLAGHEDKVCGVRWRRTANGSSLRLLSCSMDKTLIQWESDSADDGIWNESARVGEVGGNSLGFLGCAMLTEGSQMIGYSFTGSLHLWCEAGDGLSWTPAVVPGGHFGPVEDIAWETDGRYLLSVSADQTTRAHAPWSTGNEIRWQEVARPQVHGHDLVCLAALPQHSFASGAEEKIVRVFEATKLFLDNLALITKTQLSVGDFVPAAHGASVPSLGLSNKAVFEGDSRRPADDEKHVKDMYPDHYFVPQSYSRPPTEEALAQNTLWPELQKLYGHGYEIFSLASFGRDWHSVLLASSCKASKAEHAEVLLWRPETGALAGERGGWTIKQRLPGHGLTVTAMSFSPDGRHLLTGSRDRTWCLYLREDQTGDAVFEKVCGTDKKNSVHQRLIWACDWSADSNYFVTSSRDKKVAVWSPFTGQLACKAPLVLDDSVTGVCFAPSPAGYLLAAGLEDGRVVIVRWDPARGGDDEWVVECTQRIHHKTVKKLCFRPMDPDGAGGLTLASCSTDHSVKLHKIRIPKN